MHGAEANLFRPWLKYRQGSQEKYSSINIILWRYMKFCNKIIVSILISGLIVSCNIADLKMLANNADVVAADVTFVGAGDIASCSGNRAEATARILDTIPGTVFTVGDNVYQDGTAAEFVNCYEPSWGRHKNRTRPAPGITTIILQVRRHIMRILEVVQDQQEEAIIVMI